MVLPTGAEPDYGWPPVDEMTLFAEQLEGGGLEQFCGDMSGSITEEGYRMISSGVGTETGSSTSAPAKADGAARLTLVASPVAAAGAGTRLANPQFQGDELDGSLRHITRQHLDILPTPVTQLARWFNGICDAETNQGEPSDGIYFFLDENNPNWLLKHARAGVRVVRDTGFAAVAGAYQTLFFIADIPAGSIQAFAANDGNLLAPVGLPLVPSNIQPAVDVQSLSSGSSVGNRAVNMNNWPDYIGWRHIYGAPR